MKRSALNNILPTTFQTPKFEEPNGIRHIILSEKVSDAKLKGCAWYFTKMTFYNQERIKNSNMQITEQQFSHLRKLLNNSFALKYNNILYFGSPLLVFCGNTLLLMLCIEIISIAFSQWIFRFSNYNLTTSSEAALFPLLEFLGVFFLAWRGIKVKTFSKIKSQVRDLSLEWNNNTKALIFISCDPHPGLVFMMYDLKPCKEHIKARLMQLYDAANTTESERQRNAEETASHHINTYLMENYDTICMWNKLEESVACRHYTLMRKKCICELVEEKLWGNIQ